MSDNKKTMISLVTSIISLSISVMLSFFLSRFIVIELGEEANGFTQLANNFVNYATLITIALNSMAGRFVTINYYKGNIEQSCKYYSSNIIGNIIISFFLFLLAIVCVARLDKIIVIETANVNHVKILFLCVFINFFLSQYTGSLAVAFFVKNTQYLQNTINMVRALINAALLLLAFSFFKPRIFYVSFVGMLLTALSIPVYLYFKRMLLPNLRFFVSKFDYGCIREMIASGLWNSVTQCGNLLMTGFDLLLSDLFISPSRMGVLAIAKTIPTFIANLGTNVNNSFAPSLTMAYASSDSRKMLNSLRFAIKCSCFVMSIPIMALCVYGIDFYAFWMPTMNAKELSILSMLTCAAFIPLSGTQTLYNIFTASNKLKINSLSIVVGGFVNIFVVFILLEFSNLELYAIAGVSSAISILRNLFISLPYSAHILGIKWNTFYKDILVSLLCCMISGGIMFLFKVIITPTTLANILISALLGCVFSALTLFLVLLNRYEKAMLLKKITK